MDNQDRKRRWIILIPLLLAALLLLYWLFAILTRNNSEDTVEIIPDDVAMVFAIDLPQILQESDFRSVQQSSSYLNYINKASLENPIFAHVVKDPLSSGVAIDRDIFFVFDKDTSNNLEDFSALIFPLNDYKSFEKIVNSKKQSSKTILQEKGFSYYEVDQLTSIAWNERNAIFGASKAFVSMLEKMDRFFSTKPSESVIHDPEFKEVMESDADIAFWISTSAYVNDKAVLQKFALDKFPKNIIEGNYVTGSVNFGLGEVEGAAKFEFKDELRGGFDNFFLDGSMTDIYDYLPGADLTLLLSTSLNLPKIFYKGLQDEELKRKVEQILEKRELSIDDLFRIFSGELTFATYNESLSDQPAIALVMEIDNRDKLTKLLNLGIQEEIMLPEGPNQYKLVSTGGAVKTSSTGVTFPDNLMRIYLKDNYLFVVSSQKILNGLLAGKVPSQERIDKSILSQFDSYLVAGYTDLSNSGPASPQQSLKMTNARFKLDKNELGFTLELENKNEYALKEIFFSPN